MPVIPLGGESQVLNPGSPVPIGSSDTARMSGESLALFGKGMFALGDALDTAAKAERTRQQKLDLESALSEHANLSVQAKLETAKEPVAADDDSGRGGVDRYISKMDDARASILERIHNPAVAQEFTAKAKMHEAATSLDTWATELKKVTARNDQKANVIVANLAGMVSQDPRALPKALADVDAAFVDIPGLSPDKAQQASLDARRQLVTTAADKLSEDGHFGTAKRLYESALGGVFSQDEIHAKKKELLDVEKGIVKYGWEKTDRARTEKERKFKDDSNKQMVGMLVQLDGALDVSTKEAMLAQGRKSVANGQMSTEDFDILTKYAVSAEGRDDSLGMYLLADEYDKGAPIDTVQDRTKQFIQRGEMTPKGGMDAWKYFENLKQRARTDPNHQKELGLAIERLKSDLKNLSAADQMRMKAGLLPQDKEALKRLSEGFKHVLDSKKRPLDAAEEALTHTMGSSVPGIIPGVKTAPTDTAAQVTAKTREFLSLPQNRNNKDLRLRTLRDMDKFIELKKAEDEHQKKVREIKSHKGVGQ